MGRTYKHSNNLVRKYYDDALRIANSFSSKFLLQDDKEGVALLALIRASRTYKKEAYKVKKIKLKNGKEKKIKTNEKVPVKFSTHLMNCVINSLKSSVNRAKQHGPIFHNRRMVKLDRVTKEKKLPQYELQFDDWDPYRLSRTDTGDYQVRTFFDLLVDQDQGDPLVMKELLFLVRKRLNDQQNKILDFYSNLSDIKGLTYDNMGRELNCSRQRVHQQIKTIRNVFKQVQADQASENFKLTKEEQGELYG